MAPDFKALSISELLSAFGAILDELRERNIVRSSNSPLSDYAERLFCDAFGWTQEKNSASGHDAVDSQGLKYQIKGRRLTKHNPSRQLSALRRLDQKPFHFLAGVLVDTNFQIIRAALVPHELVLRDAAHVAHTNSWRFLLRDTVWTWPGVRDVSEELRAASQRL